MLGTCAAAGHPGRRSPQRDLSRTKRFGCMGNVMSPLQPSPPTLDQLLKCAALPQRRSHHPKHIQSHSTFIPQRLHPSPGWTGHAKHIEHGTRSQHEYELETQIAPNATIQSFPWDHAGRRRKPTVQAGEERVTPWRQTLLTLLVDDIPSNNTQTIYKSKSKARHPSTRSNEQAVSVPVCHFEKDAHQLCHT